MSFDYKQYLKHVKLAGIGAAVVAAVIALTATYFYLITPSSAALVYVDDFPSTLSVPFSADALMDRVVAHLVDMISTADSGGIHKTDRQQGMEPRPVPQDVFPIQTSANIQSPVFNHQWSKGYDLNFARGFGMNLKVKRFIELQVVGSTEPKGSWRLAAFLKNSPDYSPHAAGSAPRSGGSCSDLESCAKDLAEQVLRVLDYQRLLSFSIKSGTQDADRQILDLYQNTVPKPLKADALVAWGNAFYRLRRYDDALTKYQEALEENGQFCPARIARGVLYYSRLHGTQAMADFQKADQDFRAGVACDPKNALAHANLCGTLIREWVNSKNTQGPRSPLLIEAQEHCDRALALDSHMVAAAVHEGYIFYRQGKHRESLQYFDKISQQYATDSSLFANYGFLLYREYLAGNEDSITQAIDRTRQSLRNNPENYAAANNLGYFYYEKDDYEHALEHWKKANLLNGDDADCMAGLALGLYKQGQKPEAFMWLKRAINADSHYHDPDYLKRNSDWSSKAAQGLAAIIGELPAS